MTFYAYPFSPMPTLGEFVARVTSKYKGKIIKSDGSLIGPRGKTEVKSLVRTGEDGMERIAVIPDLKEHDILVPHVLRSLCIQLDIPLKDFGLPLG